MCFGEFVLFVFIKFLYYLSAQTLSDVANKLAFERLNSGKNDYGRKHEPDTDKRLLRAHEKLQNLANMVTQIHHKLSAHNNRSQVATISGSCSGSDKDFTQLTVAEAVETIDRQTDELVSLMESFFAEVEVLKSTEKALVQKIVIMQIKEHCKLELPDPKTSKKADNPPICIKDTDRKVSTLRRISESFKKLFLRIDKL